MYLYVKINNCEIYKSSRLNKTVPVSHISGVTIQYKTWEESELKFVETSNRYSLLKHIVFFYMIWVFSKIVLFPWMKVLKLYGSWIFLNEFKNVSFVDFYVDIKNFCNAWSMELFDFCKKMHGNQYEKKWRNSRCLVNGWNPLE